MRQLHILNSAGFCPLPLQMFILHYVYSWYSWKKGLNKINKEFPSKIVEIKRTKNIATTSGPLYRRHY